MTVQNEQNKLFRSTDPATAEAAWANRSLPSVPEPEEDDLEDYTEVDDVEEEEEYEDENEDLYDDPPVDEDDLDDEPYFKTQKEKDSWIKLRLKRQERKLERDLGVSLNEAKELIEAGRSISEVSGLTPAQIKLKLEERRMQYQQPDVTQGQPNYGLQDSEIKKEIAEVRSILSEDREERIRSKQEAEAKKEFGDLYFKNQEAIEDRAEELGLSLVDAAAVVLRPKLRELAEEKVMAKQKVRKARKIEGSDEGAGATPVDYNSVLTPKQKEIARRMGLTPEVYYKRGKETGLFQ